MTLEEFSKLDTSFNESMFLTKINNMFIKYLTAIMMDKLDEVKHFISEEIYNNGLEIIEDAKNNNTRHMYDELNVKESKIISITEEKNAYEIEVFLESRYMEYYISLDNGNYVSGNNHSRINVNYNLTLTKKKNTKEQNIVKKCPGCGAPLSVNTSGKCEYCGTTYNQEDYDWVITKIEKLN